MRVQKHRCTHQPKSLRPLALRLDSSRSFRGTGKEVVLVGTGGEVTCVGTERQRFGLLQDRAIRGDSMIALGARLGMFKVDPEGVVTDLTDKTVFRSTEPKDMSALEAKYQDHFYRHTGIRSLTKENIGWDPGDFSFNPTLTKTQKMVPSHALPLLAEVGVQFQVVDARTSAKDGMVEIEVTQYQSSKFKFEVTFGAPLPTGWAQSYGPQVFSRMAPKDIRRSNYSILMAIEVVARAALSAGFHPTLGELHQAINPKNLGLFLGTGIGPLHEHRMVVLNTANGVQVRPFDLAHMLGNIPHGYISPLFGIEGLHATHTGACESALGSIADAYFALKFSAQTGLKAAFAGGYETALTPDAINGFTGNTSLITNRNLLRIVGKMLEENAFAPHRQRIQGALDGFMASGNPNRLPKEITELASRAYDKYRSGFVLGEGAGVGLFMTLEEALDRCLPIEAIVAGVGAKKPDSKPSSIGITALGDGLGEAYKQAFMAACDNYDGMSIDEIGFCIGHGTSTQMNGFGERREIDRINRSFNRNLQHPLLITGDKSELGHRVGGNYPMLLSYIFRNGVPPSKNYLFPGSDDESGRLLDDLFPTTHIVGEAGAGKGQHVRPQGRFGLVTGLGFGGINTALLFKRFDIDEMDISDVQKAKYRKESEARRQAIAALQRQVDFGLVPLF